MFVLIYILFVCFFVFDGSFGSSYSLSCFSKGCISVSHLTMICIFSFSFLCVFYCILVLNGWVFDPIVLDLEF